MDVAAAPRTSQVWEGPTRMVGPTLHDRRIGAVCFGDASAFALTLTKDEGKPLTGRTCAWR